MTVILSYSDFTVATLLYLPRNTPFSSSEAMYAGMSTLPTDYRMRSSTVRYRRVFSGSTSMHAVSMK